MNRPRNKYRDFFGIVERNGFWYQFSDYNRNIGNQKNYQNNGYGGCIRSTPCKLPEEWLNIYRKSRTSVGSVDDSDQCDADLNCRKKVVGIGF
ncbi:MAG: hypothetical protein BWZ06_01578 [Bacteroidetes bacterium ADurb.BinA261]|nr:MAG: hypothetical protein BWZ06_01578 [Bacteroidetes bacterium ADurb.BinA261]